MSGTLFVCATPIGNLNDITPRVLQALQSADLIAAEDTRGSIKLLNHFDIHTPMVSYHEYNRFEKAEELIDRLRQGKNIALITDAGTPAISDPGEVLVRRCHEEGISVTSLPGACAVITALSLSGMPSRRFCFEGFLPGNGEKKERKRILQELKTESRTIILYEAPHHLRMTLRDLYEALGDRKIALCRELTKIHEEVCRNTLSEAIAAYEEKDPRGEYVLIVEGFRPEEKREEEQKKWKEVPLSEHLQFYEQQGISRKEAMKRVAADRGCGKREIYQALLTEEGKEKR
ncbi:MAG: 16S rRNA (cytidine(1402)-2'-O)-methyltransferase [Lachnospiraceae bacterium]|nr:16S rRNA (cytidine(1402)-2'-O)-methyltransferase [Lachnospiraceae bacterium]